ncbi:discoidin domain-containing protein [Brevibacillus porteri]|uniref:discoidin domain-containing protein n=1 Tax=Brevibacillus porteri TaxID=2126350 RepID=UPI003D1C0F52
MNFVMTCSKVLVSLGLIISILFFGQNVGFAEDEYSGDLIPAMTSNDGPSGLASASTEWSGNHKAYRAFDDKDDTYGWGTAGGTIKGWLQYEFPEPKKISKYTVKSRDAYKGESPKDWTFEAFDGQEWIVLDTQTNQTGWAQNFKRDFTFNNENFYTQYRINITSNNGFSSFTVIEELEMMEKIGTTNPDPNPEPNPDPKPEPTGDNALLVIKMISGLEKEFDLTASEVQDFIEWYNGRADGRGKETYMFDKDFNKGPFTARKDYVAFSKIQSFEVMEYSK